MKRIYAFAFVCLLLLACKNKQPATFQLGAKDIGRVLGEMTETMVHDVTNPPLAARFYAYACLAGYEVVAQNNPAMPTLQGRLNNYPKPHKPDTIRGYQVELAALLAMMQVAEKLQPSGKLVATYHTRFTDSLQQSGMDATTLQASQRYAAAVAKQILLYAREDGYRAISNYPRYTPVSNQQGHWYPTPPAYMAAVEPHFRMVRPFTLDSATQFKPAPPVAFNTQQGSAFYRLMEEVYRQPLTAEEKAIAAFWDCNPFAVQDNGHLLVGLKKISPGAHWLGITGIACTKAGKSFAASMEIFTAVSLGLMDGFICCWDEKYRSNRIRPETAIRQNIDPNWKPLLQTPPFPEYLSGHSTISGASATILTRYFGEAFAYDDTVEIRYGLPARKFSSFKQAAEEAAISRLYGGIHYRDAVANGLVQGELVGKKVLARMGK